MKNLVTIISIFVLSLISGQNINLSEMSSYIGKSSSEFEGFYKIEPTKKEDNFGDEKRYFDNIKLYGGEYSAVLDIRSGVISQITIVAEKDFKMFFKKNAEDFEAIGKKLNSEIFIAVTRRVNGEKDYYKSVDELISRLKDDDIDLRFYTPSVVLFNPKVELFLVNTFSFLTIK